MKKSPTKKTTDKPAEKPVSGTPKAGAANRNFRLDGVYVAQGDTVELTADQASRYGHFVS